EVPEIDPRVCMIEPSERVRRPTVGQLIRIGSTMSPASKPMDNWGSIGTGVLLTLFGGGKLARAFLYGHILSFTFAEQRAVFIVGLAVLVLTLACGLILLWDGVSGLTKRNRSSGVAS